MIKTGNLQIEKTDDPAGLHLPTDLKNGSNGDAVADFQKHLKQLGYYTGKIDAIFGSLTETSVREFQTDYMLKTDGIIDSVTRSKIAEVSSSDSVLQLGSTNIEVKTLQRQLKMLNLYSGKIDGIFGAVTDAGVKSFQKVNNRFEDGKADPDFKKTLGSQLLGENLDTGYEEAGKNADENAGDNVVETVGNALKNFFGLGNDDDVKEATDKKSAKAEAQKQQPGNAYVTAEQLKEVGWLNTGDAMLKDLNSCLERYEITRSQRLRHFISQCSVESGAGKYTMEQSWSKNKVAGEEYENRKDLGNVHPGDGPKYKGAGYIQLTGRKNYQQFADNIQDPKVMEGAEYVADKYPWTSAGFYWDREKINSLCDQGASVKEITKKVNGGYNGLDEREQYYQKCTKVFK